MQSELGRPERIGDGFFPLQLSIKKLQKIGRRAVADKPKRRDDGVASRVKKGPLESRNTSPLRDLLPAGCRNRSGRRPVPESEAERFRGRSGCRPGRRRVSAEGPKAAGRRIEPSPNGKMEDVVIRHHLLRIRLRGLLIEQNGIAWFSDPLHLLLRHGADPASHLPDRDFPKARILRPAMPLFRNDLL